MRIFTCPACGHRMRLRGERCGRCYAEKPMTARAGFYVFLLYLLGLTACLGMVVAVLQRYG